MILPALSRDLCTTFSKKMKNYFGRNPNEKMFTVSGSSVESYKYLFAWMQSCVDGNKIQKLADPVMNAGDEPFIKLANTLDAISFLDIGSLYNQAFKRVVQLAQRHVMTISEIDYYLRNYLDSGVGLVNEDGEPLPAMIAVPVESVAYGFHARKFDHDQDYKDEIGDLRDTYKNIGFDSMLEEKIMAVPDEIAAAIQASKDRKARMEAEKAAKEGGNGDYAGEGGDGYGADQSYGGGDDGGYDNSYATTNVKQSTGDWDSTPAPAANNSEWDISNDNATTQRGSSDETGGQWDEEMNQVAAAKPVDEGW